VREVDSKRAGGDIAMIFCDMHSDFAIFCDTSQNFATYRIFLRRVARRKRHVARRKRHVAKNCDFLRHVY
jgi:hypothetical protein